MNRLAKFVVEQSRLAWGLALLAILSLSLLVGGVEHNRQEQARLPMLKINAERLSIELLSQTLNGKQLGAIGLLGLIDENAKQEALNQRAPNSKDATLLMENIAKVHDADGTYIVGQDGIIKSSWGIGRPLTGVDVKFRPYTQMALKGKENVYAAIGTTTGRRNLYFAAPMYAGQTIDTPVIGAVVMRTGVVPLDKLLASTDDIALLLSPQGVVFAASNQDWIGQLAGQATPDKIKEIRQLKQFGAMFDIKAPQSLPFGVEPGIRVINGVRQAAAQVPVQWNDPYGDWKLVVIENLSRTVALAEVWRVVLATAVVLLLLGGLMLRVLRGQYRQHLAAEQLALYSQAQQASAERKSQLNAAAWHMQQAKNVEELTTCYLAEAHQILGALQGAIYVLRNDDRETLQLLGHYACATQPPAQLALGEGLLGQCAIERKMQVIQTSEDGFDSIRSGLGASRPLALMLAPIMLNDELLGVLELGLLRQPDEGDKEQFAAITQLLAMNLEILSRSQHSAEMLATTVAAEKVIAEQLAFQQALVDTIPYPLFYKGADTRFCGVNQAYEEMFNMRREALIGKRVLDLEQLPEAVRQAEQDESEACIAQASLLKREIKQTFFDGTVHDLQYSLAGFRKPDGSPGGLVGTFIDISSIKNAENELARLADAERFNRLAHGREQRILELKREINVLAQAAGQTERYATTLMETVGDHLTAPHPDYRTSLDEFSGEAPKLGDLVDLDELQKLFSSFCEAVGIAAAIIDLEGKVLAASRWQRACTDFHRVNPESCARCIESDTELALKLQDGQDFTMYTCKNGMTDCASPIIVEGMHLANVFVGQFHLGPPDLQFFREQAERFAYPQADYLQAVSEVPVADEKRLPVILGFLAGFARMISSMSLARCRADAAQQLLQQQAELLRRERTAAMSLAEDAERVRLALEHRNLEATS